MIERYAVEAEYRRISLDHRCISLEYHRINLECRKRELYLSIPKVTAYEKNSKVVFTDGADIQIEEWLRWLIVPSWKMYVVRLFYIFFCFTFHRINMMPAKNCKITKNIVPKALCQI